MLIVGVGYGECGGEQVGVLEGALNSGWLG